MAAVAPNNDRLFVWESPAPAAGANGPPAGTYIHMSANNILVNCFSSFLSCEEIAPGFVKFERTQLQAALLPAALLAPDEHEAWGTYVPLCARPTVAALRTLIANLHATGLLSFSYASVEDFYDALQAYFRAHGMLAWRVLRSADFEHGEPLAAPVAQGAGAPPAVAAGPFAQVAAPQLQIFTLSTLLNFERDGRKANAFLPLLGLARLGSLLGPCYTRAERDGEASWPRVMADQLIAAVKSTAHNANASITLVAMLLPDFMAQLCVLPKTMRSTALCKESTFSDMQDARTFNHGSKAERSALDCRRLPEMVRKLPTARRVVECFPCSDDAHPHIARLVERLLPASKEGPLHSKLDLLEEKLAQRRAFIDEQLARTPPAAGPALCAALLSDHETTHLAPPGQSSGLGGSAGDDTAAATGTGSLRDSEISKALHDAAVQQAALESEDLEGIDLLEKAYLCGSLLVLRFLASQPTWLKDRSAYLARLGLYTYQRQDYIAQALAMDVDREEVPDALADYRWCSKQCELLHAGKFSRLSYVNGDGGFLKLRAVRSATPHSPVAESEVWTLEASLDGIRDHGMRMLTALGYPAATSVPGAYTFYSLLTFYMAWVRECHQLPPQERDEWLQYGQTQLMDAFETAEQYFQSRVYMARPSGEKLEYFLPPGSSFARNLQKRRRQREKLTTIRQAFPTLMQSAPVSLPGASAPPAPAGGGDGDGEPLGKKQKQKQKQQKLTERLKGATSTRGAQFGKGKLASYLSPDKLFLAGRVYDVAGIAGKLKVGVADYCWPVLLSTKAGEAALRLCSDAATHGGPTNPKHTPPPGFDRAKLSQDFSSKATEAQMKQADWSHGKN